MKSFCVVLLVLATVVAQNFVSATEDTSTDTEKKEEIVVYLTDAEMLQLRRELVMRQLFQHQQLNTRPSYYLQNLAEKLAKPDAVLLHENESDADETLVEPFPTINDDAPRSLESAPTVLTPGKPSAGLLSGGFNQKANLAFDAEAALASKLKISNEFVHLMQDEEYQELADLYDEHPELFVNKDGEPLTRSIE